MKIIFNLVALILLSFNLCFANLDCVKFDSSIPEIAVIGGQENAKDLPIRTLAVKSKENEIPIATSEEIDELYKILESEGKVKIKKRIYNLKRTLVITNKEDYKFDGNGSVFIMEDKSADVIFAQYNKKLVLRNFKATHVEPEGPLGCTGNVIHSEDNELLVVKNCELNGSGIIGIASYRDKTLKVTNNYIYNNSQYGILYNKSVMVIKNNRFEDNGENGNSHIGNWPDGDENAVVLIKEDVKKGSLRMENNTFGKGKN